MDEHSAVVELSLQALGGGEAGTPDFDPAHGGQLGGVAAGSSEGDDLVSALQKDFDEVTTEEAGSAGHEHARRIHGRGPRTGGLKSAGARWGKCIGGV